MRTWDREEILGREPLTLSWGPPRENQAERQHALWYIDVCRQVEMGNSYCGWNALSEGERLKNTLKM